MVKLAFSTLPCHGWSIDKMIDYCKKYGFKGIELRESNDSIISVTMCEEELDGISQKLRNAKLEVTDIASGICVKGVSNEEIENALQSFRQVVRLAHCLSAKGVRIFLGNFARRYDAYKDTLDYNKIIRFIKEACDYAAPFHIQVLIETHNEFALGKRLRKLLNDVERDNCKILWDILHPLEDGEEPEETLMWFGKECVHVHVKDAIPSGDPMQHDWRYTFIGQGEVPVKRIVDLLTGYGYDGFYSLEWETVWRDELKVPGSSAEEVLPVYAKYMQTRD